MAGCELRWAGRRETFLFSSFVTMVSSGIRRCLTEDLRIPLDVAGLMFFFFWVDGLLIKMKIKICSLKTFSK